MKQNGELILENAEERLRRCRSVCSNYHGTPPAVLDMRKYNDLYLKSVTPYVRVFDTLKDASRVCKQIPEDIKEELAVISRMSREDIGQLVSTAAEEHPYFKEQFPYYDAFIKKIGEVYDRT